MSEPTQRAKATDLSCLFKDLVNTYNKTLKLEFCEMKERQTSRHADTPKTAKEYATSLINNITELRQEVESQKCEITTLKKQLYEYQEENIQLKNLYRELYEENKKLTNYKRNQVIVKFIETLTHNNLDLDLLNIEKLYKRAIAINLIYGSRHEKYVSEISLVASAIKYSIARSKTIININGQITNSGCYSRLQNYIQHTSIPWISNSLNKSYYESLFDVVPEMQEVLDKKLHIYLLEIINLLCQEKSSTTNKIDSLVDSLVCPKCGAQLPNLSELQKQCTLDLKEDMADQTIIFKPYNIEKKNTLSTVQKISITQKSVADQGVNTSEIFIPNPININLNTIANVKKVLFHIEKITGIKDGIRKWAAITCDGVPYHYITKVKNKYPWNIDLKQFATYQGYKTESQLAYFKKCHEYHKSWDSVCSIYRQAMAIELSGLYNQHQGLDVILKEINKTLKTLIPPIPQMRHWQVAAQNWCGDLKKLLLGEVVSHDTDKSKELEKQKPIWQDPNSWSKESPRTNNGMPKIPSSYKKNKFVDPVDSRTVFNSFGLIPITKEVETAQKDEINITRPETIAKMEAFLEQMGEDVQKKYSGIKFRKHDELIIILEEVRSLFSSDNDSNNDCDDSAEE
ncbi:hypothetical protein C2G38_2163148 [Gigaspora rosea]|uniref:Uncharacterized protein n=1 Tax=Gigaspora rosea TaxID=44941 RepID=A0A397VXK5_9GLOM|nr:hypothetical protein C2G38_2163148 [Gigaspora rosea]